MSGNGRETVAPAVVWRGKTKMTTGRNLLVVCLMCFVASAGLAPGHGRLRVAAAALLMLAAGLTAWYVWPADY
jgi:hypothetical protein